MFEPQLPQDGQTLADYEGLAQLAHGVRDLRHEASMLVPKLEGRTVWMVNSTAQGGGVAEMMPKMLTIFRELGVDCRWMVMSTEETAFFDLTKKLHNLIHGAGDPEFAPGSREVYEAVNRVNADALKKHLRPDDILVIHDPQPAAIGQMLKQELGIRTIWRSHIGLDEHLPQTRAAWQFLKPYLVDYDHSVFSLAEYIPDYRTARSTIIHPAIDPCSHKNRHLSPHKLVGVLCNAGLKREADPVLTGPFQHRAQRLTPEGTFSTSIDHTGFGLLYRTVITQISRWDRLKGFKPLLDAFVQLKQRLDSGSELTPRHRRRLEIMRLVMAGPDPSSIQDDPEGKEVLEELIAVYKGLPAPIQQDVALLSLPMDSRKENALMVNALQRCSTVVVQNSLREGFGLTATEAMWKRVPVLATRACGLRAQVRNGVDGLLTSDAEAPEEIADHLDALLSDPTRRDLMARSAERRATDHFLVFTQICRWLRVLADY